MDWLYINIKELSIKWKLMENSSILELYQYYIKKEEERAEI